MNYPTFPIFYDHVSAANWGCFQCGTKASHEDAEASGCTNGAGSYCFQCKRCGARSFYDLIHEHPAADAFEMAKETQRLKR